MPGHSNQIMTAPIKSSPEQSPWRGFGWAMLVYGVFLALAALPHYLAGSGLFFQVIWDPVGIYCFYPGDELVIRSFSSGLFPLWDPTRGIGAPLVIPSGGAMDYPLNIMAYLINAPWGWELYTLLRLYLAGLFCYLLGREAPIGFHGSILAGLSYMLCGYFREFQNLPDLSILTVEPLAFYIILRALRRPRIIFPILGILIIYLMDTSPESTFFTCIMVVSFYTAASLLEIHRSRDKAGASGLAGAIALFCLTLIFLNNGNALWPFVEYYHRAWHFHPEVLGKLHIPVSSIIGLVTPMFDYWIVSVPNISLENIDQLTLVPAYLGMMTFVLACVALTRIRRMPGIVLFMAAAAAVLLGVVFGVPPINLLARLPLVRYFQNFRYTQPYLALCMAIMAGMGLELLIKEKAVRKWAALIGCAVLTWVGVHIVIFRDQITATPVIAWGIAGGFGAAAAIGIAAVIAWRIWPQKGKKILAATIIVVCGLELSIYFALAQPLFGPLAFKTEPPKAAGWLASRDTGLYRITAANQRILHPNLAGIHGFADLRDQTPLYIKDYVDMMAAGNGLETQQQVMEDFLDQGRFFFEVDWEKFPPALLDLLNVKYVFSHIEPGSAVPGAGPDGVVAPAWNYVSVVDATLGGMARKAVLAHAPSRFELDLGSGAGRRARMEAGVMRGNKPCPEADGASLVAVIDRGEGRSLAYARTMTAAMIDEWAPVPFDPGDANARIELSSLPGPYNDQRCDYVTWSMPRISRTESPEKLHRFKKIYDREVMVFENTDVMPRAFGVAGLKRTDGIQGFIDGIRESRPEEKAWIMGDEQTPPVSSRAEVSGLKQGLGLVEFRARSEGASLVVLSNLYFPGWRAWVNGEETRIRRVNANMQGVHLPPGESEVVMNYQPISFRVGLWFRVAGMAAMACALFARRKRPR